MNISHHPELLDRLAASYALGTLRGAARRRLEFYARQSAIVRTNMLLWQERLGAWAELAAPLAPSANVWKRIENSLTQEFESLRPAQNLPPNETLFQDAIAKLQKAISWWRAGTVAGALATVAVVGVGLQSYLSQDAQVTQLAQQLKASPNIQYVAVLADEKSSASLLVTFDPTKNNLTLKRVGTYQEDVGKSLQLWALPAQGGAQSLGVLGQDKVIRIAASPAQVVSIPMLAISLEPKGGVPSATGPTGPVLFKGALLQTAL